MFISLDINQLHTMSTLVDMRHGVCAAGKMGEKGNSTARSSNDEYLDSRQGDNTIIHKRKSKGRLDYGEKTGAQDDGGRKTEIRA
jgi:hypothetical protein